MQVLSSFSFSGHVHKSHINHAIKTNSINSTNTAFFITICTWSSRTIKKVLFFEPVYCTNNIITLKPVTRLVIIINFK